MIFAVPGHIEKILMKDEKTQTRRRWEEGDILLPARDGAPIQLFRKGRLKYQVGKAYSIQPGRGKKSVPGRIIIVGIHKELVADISPEDCIAEGGYTKEEYLALWEKMYKVDPRQDWCWVLVFRQQTLADFLRREAKSFRVNRGAVGM